MRIRANFTLRQGYYKMKTAQETNKKEQASVLFTEFWKNSS
jgi:hypothetical protein